MYRELKGNENFSDKYTTWIIAYCLDTDSFFATNQRHFFWEYDDEFQCENDAINYFRNHLNEFRNARKEILSNCGGWSIDKDLFLENTKESFSNTNSGDNIMKGKYKGCDIEVGLDSSGFLTFAVFDNGYTVISGFSDSSDTVRDYFGYIKSIVDDYKEHPEDYE